MPKNNSNSAPVWAWAFVKLKYFNLSLALIITLFLGYKATQIKFNFSPDNIYLADDPAYQIYKSKFIKHFGDNAGFCIAGIEGDLNHPNTKKALFELHDRFENLKNINFYTRVNY